MAEATANLIERMGNQALFLDTRHPKLDSPAARTMREAAVALERVERTSWERIKQENQRAIDAEAQVEALRKALEGCVAWIVDLGESGDAGFWDGNQTPEVIAARAALAGSTPESSVEAPARFGCHVDLAPDEEPDGCVIDYGAHTDCIYAVFPSGRLRRKKETCEHWRRVIPTPAEARSEQAEGEA